jgi:hypothetical protein
VPVGEYANLSVRRSVREELDRLRSELGINDLNDLLVLLVRTYREHTNTVSKVVELLTSISSKLDELLTRVASSSVANPTTSSSSSSTPSLTSVSSSSAPGVGGGTGGSAPPPDATSPPPATTKGAEDIAESHIWCRKKAEVRNLKGFLEWVGHSYGLLDWWEEGDNYCFETRRSPKQEKGEKRRRGGGGG